MSWLPFMALEASSLRKYLRQGIDFAAFCHAKRVPILPASFANLGGYFLDYFLRGNTSRTFSSISTRLKWFYLNVLESPFLDTCCPSEHRQWLRLRKALLKLDDVPVKKARPLYSRILKMLALVVDPQSVEELQVLACFSLAHAAIQRLGELLDGAATLRHLRCFDSPQGPFFCFFYFLGNKPKNFKISQAPFALVSRVRNPFAFNVIDTYLRCVFGDYDVPGSVCFVPSSVGEGRSIFKYSVSDYNSDSDINSIGDFCGVDQKSPLFPRLGGRARTSSHLPKSRAISILRTLLSRAKIPSPHEYSGHSARRGGYVDRLHVPLRYVQIQGHWAPGSATTDQDYNVHNIPLRMKFF